MYESARKVETQPSSQQYRTLLEVSEAIVFNRELSALFKDLAGLLHRVARFDYLWLNLHDGAGDSLHLHVIEATDPATSAAPLPVQDLAMWVWQNQRPVVTSITSQAEHWPDYYQWAQRLGMNSLCVLPLTTAGRRLGSLGVRVVVRRGIGVRGATRPNRIQIHHPIGGATPVWCVVGPVEQVTGWGCHAGYSSLRGKPGRPVLSRR